MTERKKNSKKQIKKESKKKSKRKRKGKNKEEKNKQTKLERKKKKRKKERKKVKFIIASGGWLIGFYGISTLCRLFNTKSIFMQIVCFYFKQFSFA